MTLLDNAIEWFNGVKAAPVERRVADMITNPAGVTDDKFPDRVDGKSFEPGMSYFGIRLAGFHMVDARRFAERRLPLCVCLVEFEHDGQRRTVPFSIGPDIIRRKLSEAGIKDGEGAAPAWIELRDLTVVRPTPVNEANVSVYAGLFSMPQSDLVKTLLNVVGTVGTALGQPAVSGGLKVAETVYDSFGAFLGLGEVEELTAALIGNALTATGSGYLLIAKAGPEEFDPRRGRVVSGRLHWPLDRNGGKAVVQFDHALLALEQYDTIIQKGTGLAPALFQSQWSAVLKAPHDQAKAMLGRLQDAIAASPDVTEADRIALIGGYSLTFERLAKARQDAMNPDDAARGSRSSDDAGPGLVKRLTQVQLDLPEDDDARGAIGTLAEAMARQSVDWDDDKLAARFTKAAQDVEDTAVLDDAILDAAVSLRSALTQAEAGKLPSSTRIGLSSLVNRAAQF